MKAIRRFSISRHWEAWVQMHQALYIVPTHFLFPLLYWFDLTLSCLEQDPPSGREGGYLTAVNENQPCIFKQGNFKKVS